MGKRVLLEPPSLDEVTGYDEDFDRLTKMKGLRGKTVTLLNPGGLVMIDGERLHCVSAGMLIDPDIEVEVVGVQGNELVVRLAPKAEVRKPAEPTTTTSEPDDPFADFEDPKVASKESHLDFDVPSA